MLPGRIVLCQLARQQLEKSFKVFCMSLSLDGYFKFAGTGASVIIGTVQQIRRLG